MDKETQNLIWSCLPHEYKKEVKRQYRIAINGNQYFIQCTLEYLFGLHYLTSDAEGEKMLTVEANLVKELYQRAKEIEEESKRNHSPLVAAKYRGVQRAIEDLFGSKCLPDENSSNLEKLEKNGEVEPKQAEPKFKVGDKVKDISSPHDDGIYKVDDIKKSSDGFIYHIQGLIGKSNVKESALEPYTQPATYDFKAGDKVRYKEVYTIEGIEKDGIALVDSDFLVDPEDLELYEEPKADKAIKPVKEHFDSILKDSFSKERRLNIAAMITQGIMANPSPQMVEMDVHRVADLAILMTDTLIAGCEKGG